MIDPAPLPAPSPYQPPATIADEENRLIRPGGGGPVVPLPIAVSAVFALAATVLSGLLALVSEWLGPWFVVALVCSPLLFLAAFVLLCLHWYASQPLMANRSLGRRALMSVVVPPIALLIFIPSLVATSLAVFAFGYAYFLLVIPVLLAYFLTAVGISRWLWWWFASAADVS